MTAVFLQDFSPRPVKLATHAEFQSPVLAMGQGASPLEVVITQSTKEPALPAVRAAWKNRQQGRAAPLILISLYGDNRAALCGPAGDEPPAYVGVDAGQVERICREALQQPDRHAALRSLRDALPAVESRLPGLRNEGFLATHELATGARGLKQWPEAERKARSILSQRGEQLLKSLGFKIDRCDQVTSILRAGDDKRLGLAVLLQQAESPELQAARFNGLSPVSYALSVADRENLPYVIVCQGAKLRLYPVKVGLGVGRRGRTETYVEIHTGLLKDSDAAYLWLLFSGEALAEGGTLDVLLAESRRFAGDLAVRLRERIYNLVVPELAQGLVTARGQRKPKAQDLADTYEMAMTLLFRLLFLAYAEDKDLLPYRWNGLYRARSLKTKAAELLEVMQAKTAFNSSDALWKEACLLFAAVESGNKSWGIPAYDGGLFSTDEEVSRVGAQIAKLSLPDSVMGPVLRDLLIIETPEGWGPVDFRSLGVREFGTIYEGLLESELSLAASDLTLDREGFYRPAGSGDDVVVKAGKVYLHNRSGARKATGAYFTKQFAVEHLLDHALEPALAGHAARLDKLSEDEAAKNFFDFRVADIAMGSGHFLVAAVDRIEKGLTGYLARRPLSGVRTELAQLRVAAEESLGNLAEQIEIEDTQLLRRLIARRCIYGVDLNPVSVNLARLSIWIHTFVAGLPLSLLDHNLVVGNSLVGIGRLSEISHIVKEEGRALLSIRDDEFIGDAMKPLSQLASIADKTATEVKRARKALAEAREAVRPAEAPCDVATASRIQQEVFPLFLEDWESLEKTVVDSKEHRAARKSLAHLPPFHFPIAFPEVFLRERSGFDVILGNPPWEEATLEELAFWARHEPGLRGLNSRQKESRQGILRNERLDMVTLYEEQLAVADAMRQALTTGPYPGMGTGDPDLYKAFCWRFWNLISAQGGWIGVVLPRSALSAKGTAEFRLEVFKAAEPVGITMLVNNRQWVFPEVHPQYSIGLCVISRRPPTGKAVRLLGPFASRERFEAGKDKPPAEFTGKEVMGWTDSASLPLLPTDESLDVFVQLRKAPRLDLDGDEGWRVRPHRELDATNDKGLMDLKAEKCPTGYWPVFKGESFDIWQPDTGRYYGYADPTKVIPALQKKRLNSARLERSAFAEFDSQTIADPKTLPCHRARIAFRDISRATDSRTVRVALIPPKTFITNKGPYFLWPKGDSAAEAFLLGVLASIVLDWYARRFVETGLNFFIVNPFPVPRPKPGSDLAKRVVSLSGRLATPDNRFADWAAKVGVKCGPLADDEKQDHIHELDAVVAHLYGLSERHLTHIFETFHEGWDYVARLGETLKHYRNWKSKL